jgi:predicted PurR-regulated permease PerM
VSADPGRRFLGLDARRQRLAGDTALILAVALGIAALLILAWFSRQGLIWILAGAFLAFSIDPLVQLLRRRLKLGVGKAISLAFGIIAALLLVITFIVVPPMIDQAKALEEKIPQYVAQLQGTSASDFLNADGAIAALGSAAKKTVNLFRQAGRIVDLVGAAASGLFALFMIFTFTIYFLVYGRGLRRGIAARLPARSSPHFLGATREMYEMNQGYWYGKFLIALIAGTTCWVGMTVLGLPFAAPLSVFVAITDLIPNIGATIGTIPVAIVGFLEEPWKGVVITAWLILYQQVENNLITPKVFKKTVEMHPLVSIVAVTLGGMMFGILGTLLAIPAVKAAQIAAEGVRASRAAGPQPPPLS